MTERAETGLQEHRSRVTVPNDVTVLRLIPVLRSDTVLRDLSLSAQSPYQAGLKVKCSTLFIGGYSRSAVIPVLTSINIPD